jgi:hypothetical protein
MSSLLQAFSRHADLAVAGSSQRAAPRVATRGAQQDGEAEYHLVFAASTAMLAFATTIVLGALAQAF